MDTVRQENRRDVASRILQRWGLEANQRDFLLDDKESVLAVLDIYESLNSIFYGAGEERAATWTSQANAAFDGLSAIDVMLAGDIDKVAKYLRYHVYNA